jgi:D-alanine transaminase
VARAHLIKTCREFGIPVREEPYTLDELMGADEIIVTASGTLCRPICEVDGVRVGGKAPELLKKLQDALLGDFMAKTEK